MQTTKTILIALLIVAIGSLSGAEATRTEAQNKFQLRCGWFSNPTPANAWLLDKDGEWTISIQGGYQAEGDWPDIKESQWVKTNVHYGYGCACIRASVDNRTMRVIEIKSGYGRTLSACRKDKALKEPK
jgi:hypothetical protein